MGSYRVRPGTRDKVLQSPYSNIGGPGPGLSLKRTRMTDSTEPDKDRVALKATQTRAARKAKKPTVPRMPWYD
jgi:hypothetical protein